MRLYVPLNSTLFDTEANSFFVSGLPTCYGYKNPDWKYEIVTKKNFEVNADIENEYTLFIQDKKHDRIRFNPSRRFKYFCFDNLKGSGSIALTCPKEELSGIIPKCCPKGESISELHSGGCKESRIIEDWSVAVNGYVHNAKDLMDNSVLVHVPNRVPKWSNQAVLAQDIKPISRKNYSPSLDGTCPGFMVYDYRTDALHIGPDAKLHYPESDLDDKEITKIEQTSSFCIDAFAEDEDYEYDYDYNADDYDEETIDEEPPSCQKKMDLKSVQIIYCQILWDDEDQESTTTTVLKDTSEPSVTSSIQNVPTTSTSTSQSVFSSTTETTEIQSSTADIPHSTTSTAQSESTKVHIDKIIVICFCILFVFKENA